MLNPSAALECYFLLRKKSPHPNVTWQEDTGQGSKNQISSPHACTFHLFSKAKCLHSYKQSICLKVLIPMCLKGNHLAAEKPAVSHATHLSNIHFPHALTSTGCSQISLSFLVCSAIRIWCPHLSHLIPHCFPLCLHPSPICNVTALPLSPLHPEPTAFRHPSSRIL